MNKGDRKLRKDYNCNLCKSTNKQKLDFETKQLLKNQIAMCQKLRLKAKASERAYGVKDISQDRRPKTANEQSEFILIIGGLRVKPPAREALLCT